MPHPVPILRLLCPCLAALTVALPPPVRAAESPDPAASCARPVLGLLKQYRALAEEDSAPGGDLLSLFEDALITDPDCAPALTGVTVSVLDGQDDLIRRVIRTALETVPAHTDAILQAAREASRESGEAVASASRDTMGEAFAVPPDGLLPTRGAALPTAEVSPAPEEADPQTEDFVPAREPDPLARTRFPARRVEEIGQAPLLEGTAPRPFDLSVSLGGGFDSNAGTSPAEVDSAYVRAGLGAKVQQRIGQTRLDLAAGYTLLEFLEPADGLRQTNSTAGLDLSVSHGVPGRWSLVEELQLLRDTEPDLLGGVTTALRVPGYLTLHQRLSATFQATPLWTLGAGYTLRGIDHAGGATAVQAEDRLSHAVGAETRHVFLGVIDLTASYQAEFTDFRRSALDFTRHSVLAGFDTPFGDRTRASLAAGAQVREGGSGGSLASPFAEMSFRHDLAPAGGGVSWIHRYGQLEHELALLGFDQREGYLSRLAVDHPAGDRLHLHASAGLLASRFTEPGAALEETAFIATLGATWELLGDVDLNAGYHFVSLDSPLPSRAYDRHQVGLGLTRSF